MIFILVSNDCLGLVLTTAESRSQKEAVKELKDWAKRNSHTIARSANDDDATALIQSLELVSR